MSSLLTKRISASHHHHHHLNLFPQLLLRLSLSTQVSQQNGIPFIAQYLISSFGFSTDRALKAATSRNLSPIKTADRPNSVVQFLKVIGLLDAQIKSLVLFHPNILSSNVDKTLEPRWRELISAGFTRETLTLLIQQNPLALNLKKTISRLQFWRNFVGNSDEMLSKIIWKNGLFIHQDIDILWLPKITLLKEYGLSQQDIVKILSGGFGASGRSLYHSINNLKQILERTKDLGFPCGSGMFCKALIVVGSLKKETWDKKVEFFKNTYGWTEEEILCALKKYPTLFSFSNKNVKAKTDFLIKKAAVDPKTLLARPILLARSLDKVLVPRHQVLCLLKEKGFGGNYTLAQVCLFSEKTFVEKLVEPYKEKVPGLATIYEA